MKDKPAAPNNGGFHYNRHYDTNDGKPWSEMDVEDLKNHVAHGATLEETASFLCQAGTALDVAEKAKELGLHWQKGGQKRKGPR